MAKFDGFLLLSDVDNTLLSNDKIPPKNIEKIKYFTENGGLFTIVTGRGLAAAFSPWKRSLSNTHLVCFNGGMIYDVQNKKPLYRDALSKEDKEFFCRTVEKFDKVGVEVHVGEEIYILRDSKDVRWHCEYESVTATLVKAEEIIDKEWDKGQLALDIDNPELTEEIAEYIKAHPLKNSAFAKTSIGDGKHDYFELHSTNANKGEAVKLIKKFTGAKKVFTIGDYFNDIGMFENSDVSACVSDAPEEVKKIVDYVVCSCVDGAVGEFIDIIEKTEAYKCNKKESKN